MKLYEIENKKFLSASQKNKKYLDKLEEKIYKLKHIMTMLMLNTKE